jgi:serine/threonine protein phosphatase PrpC
MCRDDKRIHAVADGVGGLPYGSLASLLATQYFDALIPDTNSCVSEHNLREICHLIHQNILKCGAIVGGQNGIGTTFSGVRFLSSSVLFAHVGDSSILHYTADTGEVLAISKSHTLAAELIAKHGEDAARDMPDHYSHTLTRCMGQDIDFEVDAGEIKYLPGDKFILCTDGLTNMVELEQIRDFCSRLNPQGVVHELVDLANQNGGLDNTTVVCIQPD